MTVSPASAEPAREVLAGLVERVTFHNEKNGFCVLRMTAHGRRDLVTVVGHAATIAAGKAITASGLWVNDRTHGLQFKAHFLKASAPSTAAVAGYGHLMRGGRGGDIAALKAIRRELGELEVKKQRDPGGSMSHCCSQPAGGSRHGPARCGRAGSVHRDLQAAQELPRSPMTARRAPLRRAYRRRRAASPERGSALADDARY